MHDNSRTHFTIGAREAYTLGFIWADGYIFLPKNCRNYVLILEFSKEDNEDIKHIIENVIPQTSPTRTRQKRTHWKPTIVYRSSDKSFVSFLVENDFHLKSSVAPTKVLKQIPQEYYKYWMLGFFDGDGCIYVKEACLYQLSWSGPVNYDWSFLFDFLVEIAHVPATKIQVKNIQRIKSSHSELKITDKKEIKKVYNIFYNDSSVAGLDRKKQKFEKISYEHYKHSRDTRKKMGAAHLPCSGKNNSNAKKWVIVDNGGEFYYSHGNLEYWEKTLKFSYGALKRKLNEIITNPKSKYYNYGLFELSFIMSMQEDVWLSMLSEIYTGVNVETWTSFLQENSLSAHN